MHRDETFDKLVADSALYWQHHSEIMVELGGSGLVMVAALMVYFCRVCNPDLQLLLGWTVYGVKTTGK